MGLKDVLSRMKLVELEPSLEDSAPAAPSSSTAGLDMPMPPLNRPTLSAPAGKRPQTVEEILASIPAAPPVDEKALAAAQGAAGEVGGGDIPDFPDIYSAAGIRDPAHGYSSHKVLEIFSSPEFAPLEPKAKAAALSGFLKMNPTGPVPIADVIQDAVRRDQALDKFEEFLRARLGARSTEVEKETARLQAEIDALTLKNREMMAQNRLTLTAEQNKLERWQTAKRMEEKKLFDAVAPFVDGNPISLGAGAAPDPSASSASPAPAAPDASERNNQ